MKRLWLLLAVFFLLACTCSAPPLILATRTPLPAVEQVNTFAPANFTLVHLHPQDGGLTGQLHAEAPKAAALGQHMFVEFDAAW